MTTFETVDSGKTSKMQMKYFEIDKGREASNEPSPACRAALRSIKCKCGYRKLNAPLIAVDLERRPIAAPNNSVGGSTVGMIRRDLLDAIGEELFQSEFIVGAVTVNGEVNDVFRSYIGRTPPTTVRGDATSWTQFCSECERQWYLGLGDKYILSQDVADGRKLYSTSDCGIIVREDVASVASAARIKKLSMYELPVIDHPNDGLPCDLGRVPRDFSRGMV